MSYKYTALSGRLNNAPYVKAEVFTPNEPTVFDLNKGGFSCFGLLDTGSPATFIPESILRHLEIPSVGEAQRTMGVGGIAYYKPYIASLKLAEKPVYDINVYGWEKEMALIGRNILTKFHICFNGKDNTFRFIDL